MIEEATVDCYNESEQVTGWFTMIEDKLEVPFETTVLGVQVMVEHIDLDRSEEIALHQRDVLLFHQRISSVNSYGHSLSLNVHTSGPTP